MPLLFLATISIFFMNALVIPNTKNGDIVAYRNLKGVMGKIIMAERADYMIQEVGLKVLYFNKLRENERTHG